MTGGILPTGTSFAEKMSPGRLLRRLLLAWLLACAAQYAALPLAEKSLSGTEGLLALSFPLTLILLCLVTVFLSVAALFYETDKIERWALFFTFGIYLVLTVRFSFSLWFTVLGVGILAILGVYAEKGGYKAPPVCEETPAPPTKKEKWISYIPVAVMMAFFVLFVCLITVYRILVHRTPTFDFGIFSQMFYYMKETGLPFTTCERGGLLSHFAVHMSPVYYLVLPFYALFPHPVTLAVVQALALASGAIPLYLLAKRRGVSPMTAALLSGVLLFFPAYAGGTCYDFHENKFLTPLLLWLFYFAERKSIVLTGLFALLSMSVKEDAPVYVAVFALYLVLRGLFASERADGKRPWSWQKMRYGVLMGAALFLAAIGYFLAVTGYLAEHGDGVMTYRYQNFMYGEEPTLFTVIKAVVMSPMKALFESTDIAMKTEFFLQTMAPLLFLPFFTRKYERFALLIPYFLINLMSDYQYQSSIYYQYTYGATAFLLYLTVLNLADLPRLRRKQTAALALAATLVFFAGTVLPRTEWYKNSYNNEPEYHQAVDEALAAIPEEASVSATTHMTTMLSERRVLNDLYYGIYYGRRNAIRDGMSSADAALYAEQSVFGVDYVVIQTDDTWSLEQFDTVGDKEHEVGLANIMEKLKKYGYVQVDDVDGRVLIFQKQAPATP